MTPAPPTVGSVGPVRSRGLSPPSPDVKALRLAGSVAGPVRRRPGRAGVAGVCRGGFAKLAADGVFDLGTSEPMGAAWGARRAAASQGGAQGSFSFAPFHRAWERRRRDALAVGPGRHVWGPPVGTGQLLTGLLCRRGAHAPCPGALPGPGEGAVGVEGAVRRPRELCAGATGVPAG